MNTLTSRGRAFLLGVLALGLLAVVVGDVYALTMTPRPNGTNVGVGVKLPSGDLDNVFQSTHPYMGSSSKQKVHFHVEACCTHCDNACASGVCGVTIKVDFRMVGPGVGQVGPIESRDNSASHNPPNCPRCDTVVCDLVLDSADTSSPYAGWNLPSASMTWTVTTECYCCDTWELYGESELDGTSTAI